MPRLKNRPPKLSRHKSGQAFVRQQGRNIYLGRWGSTEAKAAYREFRRNWRPAPVTECVPDTERITVIEVLSQFVEQAERRYTKAGRPTSSILTFRTPIRVMRELYGETPAAKFGPLALERVRSEFVRRGLSRSVANRYARLIIAIFRWAVSREIVAETVPTRLSCLQPLRPGETDAHENEKVLPVDDATVERTLPHLTSVVRSMVLVQRLTGMRPAEVCELRPADIDRTESVWRYRPQRHKLSHLGRERVVLVGPKAQEVLLPFLLRPAGSFCFSPAESVAEVRAARNAARRTPANHGNGVGSNRRRKPTRKPSDRYSTLAYSKAIKRAALKAGVEHWTPNQLRHAAATEARAKFGLEVAQQLLGHSLRATTERHYAEIDIAGAAAAIAKIG